MKYLSVLLILLSMESLNAQETPEVKAALTFQEEMNSNFKNAETSPLMPEALADFNSLNFFPIDSKYYIVAEFVRTPYESPFEMPTTTERKPIYVKYGEAYFTLEGKEHKLNLYQNLELISNPVYVDYLFIPFTDLTNGVSTYGGGRYLDLQIPVANKIILDFNQAYNPYCAYNGKYSCPIPPEENDLKVEIKAGVKAFEKS